jgi:pyruvate kinase
MQQRIINRVESDPHYHRYLDQITASTSKKETATDAVTVAARQIAQTVKAKAIVCFTLRGSTVRRASQERATVPVLAITPFKETARQLVMSWGVYPDLPRSGKSLKWKIINCLVSGYSLTCFTLIRFIRIQCR